jgi:hypothetical protein
MRALGGRAVFVRGNGERAVLEIASGERTAKTAPAASRSRVKIGAFRRFRP